MKITKLILLLAIALNTCVSIACIYPRGRNGYHNHHSHGNGKIVINNHLMVRGSNHGPHYRPRGRRYRGRK